MTDEGPTPGEPGTPGWTGRTDQAKAGARDFAGIIAYFYQGLRLHGVPEDAATTITVAYVKSSSLSNRIGLSVKEILDAGGFK